VADVPESIMNELVSAFRTWTDDRGGV
jgi:hypothetical protein